MTADRPTSVIVAGARTPMGRLLGSLKDFSGSDLGGVAIKGALEKAGVAPEQVDYVIMGQVLQAGAGQIPARQAAAKRRHPDDRPRPDDQQGLPLGHQRHRHGRPADPRRRVRRRRRRRPGVDDERAAPADEVARGLQVRRRDDARPHGLRRPVGRLHRPGHGAAHRAGQHRRAGVHPRGAGRVLGPQPPARRQGLEGRPLRRRGRRRCSIPQRKGDPIDFKTDEGIRADTTTDSLGEPASGLQQGRHDHGRLRLARSPTAPPRSSS